MVSKAREDLPEPESPVTTVRVLRGMLTLTLRRLCWRAPRTVMCVIPMQDTAVPGPLSDKSLGYGIRAEGKKCAGGDGVAALRATRGTKDVSEVATVFYFGGIVSD